MEQIGDLRRYDRVWQRVAPSLRPWPETGSCAGTGRIPTGAVVRTVTGDLMDGPPSPAEGASRDRRTDAAEGSVPDARMTAGDADPTAAGLPTASLPTADLTEAERDPCCMGSEAMDDLTVLEGFIEEELEEQRAFLSLSRQAPLWARPVLREAAAVSAAHARRLTAVRYLIAGEERVPAVPVGPICPGGWRQALRERYHARACDALNYERAAEGTPDPCLAEILEDLGAGARRQAAEVLRLLERSLGT